MVNSKLSHAMNNLRVQIKTGKTRGRHPRPLSNLELVALEDRLSDLEYKHKSDTDMQHLAKSVVDGNEELLKQGKGNKEELLRQGEANKKELLDAINVLRTGASSSSGQATAMEAPVQEIETTVMEEMPLP